MVTTEQSSLPRALTALSNSMDPRRSMQSLPSETSEMTTGPFRIPTIWVGPVWVQFDLKTARAGCSPCLEPVAKRSPLGVVRSRTFGDLAPTRALRVDVPPHRSVRTGSVTPTKDINTSWSVRKP